MSESDSQSLKFKRDNNLDWLRLIFALQVIIVHAGEHLHLPFPEDIGQFPGCSGIFFHQRILDLCVVYQLTGAAILSQSILSVNACAHIRDDLRHFRRVGRTWHPGSAK